MRDANKVVAKALETAGLNARDFALKMGISSSSLRKYGYDSRTPTPPLLKRLARLLRQQARELQRVSRELEQVARKEKATLWLHRVPGGRRRGEGLGRSTGLKPWGLSYGVTPPALRGRA